MKIRVLSRSDAEWSGRADGTPTNARASKNPTPSLHAPKKPLDVQRSIVAAKLNRNLARPFLFACAPSHIDGVYAAARSRSDLTLYASAAADGEVRLWHLPSHSPRFHMTPQPAAFTRGITFSHDSSRLLFCTDAKITYSAKVDTDYVANPELVKSLDVYRTTAGPLSSISASFSQPHFATASSAVQIWDESRSAPLSTISLTSDSLHCVRYNPVETNVLASAGSDRSITFYDVRTNVAIRRFVLKMRTNDISWNPMEAMTFVSANDDQNCYTYDMRNLSDQGARTVHESHTGPVMSVDYSPTGEEFVSGSYDKTIRIFTADHSLSREIYHTKRMQRVFTVNYSLDAAYVISGSDDGDVRVWKNERSRPLKPLFRAEKEKILASERLIDRYRGIDEVRKIAHKRHLPAHVKSMQATKSIMKKSQERKEENVRRHLSKAKRPKRVPRGKQNIVRELE